VLAGQERKFLETLLGALGRPDLIALCLQGPGPHQRPVIDFLQDTFGQQTLAELTAWMARLDVCFAPVSTLPEAFDDRNVAARGMVLTDARGRRHIAPVIRFADEPPAPDLHEPALGEHSEEILAPLRDGGRRRVGKGA
jgi:crotonobetainyl-CoA:carnitine CoA-transferase CaiB-like acyl-CoA transferase